VKGERPGEADRRIGGSAGGGNGSAYRRAGETWEAHVTSRDPTLDAVGTRSCAIRRGMSKKRATGEVKGQR
jgi:hypothetical protein